MRYIRWVVGVFGGENSCYGKPFSPQKVASGLGSVEKGAMPELDVGQPGLRGSRRQRHSTCLYHYMCYCLPCVHSSPPVGLILLECSPAFSKLSWIDYISIRRKGMICHDAIAGHYSVLDDTQKVGNEGHHGTRVRCIIQIYDPMTGACGSFIRKSLL